MQVIVQLVEAVQINQNTVYRFSQQTQFVPLPELTSKFIIAHSSFLRFVGRVSLKKTPRKIFKPIFFTAFKSSKLLRAL